MISESLIEELQTLRDMLRWIYSQFLAADLYYGHGTDNAWDEALALIFHVLHLPFNAPPDMPFDIFMDARLTKDERRNVLDLCQQRIEQRIPLSYLTQCAYFAGLPFYVDRRVLIPRSPIAELIEQNFEPWITERDVHRILDLCTGSGSIAVASAFAFENATVDAIDNSEAALHVAQKNVKKHHLENRVQLIFSDLFTALENRKNKHRYDIIVSNPPYVSGEEYESLPPEYRHEPRAALRIGDDGLEIVIKILKHASRYLTDHGILVVEVGNAEAALVERFPNVPFLWLEFSRGGQGVFLLTADQLKTCF